MIIKYKVSHLKLELLLMFVLFTLKYCLARTCSVLYCSVQRLRILLYPWIDPNQVHVLLTIVRDKK